MGASEDLTSTGPVWRRWFGGSAPAISLVVLGNSLSQVITVGSAPLLSRLYTPAAMGEFATYVSLATVGAVLATAAFDQAVTTPHAPAEALSLVYLAAGLSFAAALVAALIVLGGNWRSGLAWFVPGLLGLSGIANTFTAWATREGNFGHIVGARLGGAVLGIGTMIALGFAGNEARGLLAGQLVGIIATLLILALPVFRAVRALRARVTFRTLTAVLRAHRRFPQWLLPSTLLNSVANQMPIWFLNQQFGAAVTGQYSLVNRVLNAPVTLVGNSVGEVFKQRAGSAYRAHGECREIFGQFTLGLAILGVLFCLPLIVAGPALFEWAFGPAWREAGEIARVLSVLFFFRFVVSPLSFIVIIAARPHLDLALQIMIVASAAAGWLTAALTHSLYWALGVFSGCYVLVYATYFWISRRIAQGARQPL